MSDETKTTRPRETTPALVSAGGEGAQAASGLIPGLPFDPHSFVVGEDLKEALTAVDTKVTLDKLQAFDSRTTAAAYYERRIKELAQGAEEA